jgi:predicted RND superfamily exporter protein
LKKLKEEDTYRKVSQLILLVLTLLFVFLGYRGSQLQFDYDFEKFFPQDNDDLSFFHEYRETFENDNDFILIGLVNRKGIFKEDFLHKVENLTQELRTLPHLREVISPLEQHYFEMNPMGLGLVKKPYFSINTPSRLPADSIYLSNCKDPIREMLAMDSNSLLLLIKNTQLISKKKSDELASALQEMLKEQDFDEIHLMGKIIGQKAYIDIMQWEFFTFSLISISILLIILFLAYRSVWGIVIPLLTVLLAVIGSLGVMQLSGASLNMMTTLLPVIMLVVGMSDVIHLVSKYLEEVRAKHSKLEALRRMIKKVGVATLLTSLTTALGFITLIGVNMEPVRNFGIFTAIGVVLAFVVSIIFIPSIFLLLPKPKIARVRNAHGAWEKKLGKLFIFLCRYRYRVLVTYGLITIFALWGTSKLQFDYFLMQDLGEDQVLMQELRYFQKNYGGIRPFEMAIIPQGEYKLDDYEVLKELEKIEKYLREEYQVNQLLSPAFPFQYLNKVMRSGKEAYFKIPDNKDRFSYLKKQLETFKGREEWQQLIAVDGKMGRMYGRMIDPGSREMLSRNAALKDFYEKNIRKEVLQYKLTGTPVIIDESGRQVSHNVIVGLFIAFGIIALSMGFLFRSVKMACLSLVPNIFPILLTAGFIGFAGISLNMTTAIVFTVAFGIAVDDTIHFMSRYRQEVQQGSTSLYALKRTFISTGKAIVITSIILLGGFGSLLFSDFLSTFYIGLFVSMTLITAVLTDLSLLPVLLLSKKKK